MDRRIERQTDRQTETHNKKETLYWHIDRHTDRQRDNKIERENITSELVFWIILDMGRSTRSKRRLNHDGGGEGDDKKMNLENDDEMKTNEVNKTHLFCINQLTCKLFWI